MNYVISSGKQNPNENNNTWQDSQKGFTPCAGTRTLGKERGVANGHV